MARIQITGSQIKSATITNSNIVDGTIAEAKLVDSGKYLLTGTARDWTIDQKAGGKKLTGLAVGTNPTDAVTYQQLVDNSAGLDPKESVVAATVAAITLSGEQTIDGVGVVVSNRVLVKDQATASANGIYIVSADAWTRATDFDGAPTNEVGPGNYTFVEQGTKNAGCGFVVVGSVSPIVIGTNDVVWTQFSGAGLITAGSGLVKDGNVIDVRISNGLEFNGAGSDFIGVKLDGSTLSVGANGLKLSALTSAYILVGSGTDVATGVAVSGDVSITNLGAVTIGNGAVTTVKIDALAVTAVKLATDAVETLKIKDLNVTTGKLADKAVTTAKIDDVAVTAAQLATDAVETLKIKDANVTAAKLATDSVETLKIKDLNVTTGKLADKAVTTAKIDDVAVTAAQLATDAVETLKIKDLNVTNGKLADATITSSKLSTALLKVDGFDWGTAADTSIASTLAIKNYLSNATSFIDEEVPTGSVNGTNVTYVLANTPVATSLKVYLNGQRLKSGSGFDYTLSTATITLSFAPETNDVIVTEYRKSA